MTAPVLRIALDLVARPRISVHRSFRNRARSAVTATGPGFGEWPVCGDAEVQGYGGDPPEGLRVERSPHPPGPPRPASEPGRRVWSACLDGGVRACAGQPPEERGG